MNLELFASYGVPGLVIGGLLLIAYRLVDRGFSFEVPAQPKTNKRRRP